MADIPHAAAHTDTLTGLKNRTAFQEDLSAAMAVSRATGFSMALMFVNLDEFKRVNDNMGHAAGDALLCHVAQMLCRAVDLDPGQVSRVGGDEFAVIVPGVAGAEDAARVAKQVLDALEPSLLLGSVTVQVSASIGIALYDGEHSDPDRLLRQVNMALCHAKQRGPGRYSFFSPEMAAAAAARVDLERGLRGALERQEFVLHYEPLVEAASGRIVGCEALIRWRHPERGMVSPGVFIPVAEDTGLIAPIGSWVLREACRQFMQWQRDGVPVSVVSVNASVHQFQRPDFVDEVAQVLRESGMPGSGLKLELTESLLMDEPREVERRLAALAAMGVSLALDDFGTGYSSLTYLKRLPVDSIKLDRSFVRDLLDSDEARKLAYSAITMLHALRKQVVVEGVELKPQRELLAGWGADLLQGWLFSKSQPGDAFADYVRRAPVAPVAGGVSASTPGVVVAVPAETTADAAAAGSVLVAGKPETVQKPLELLGT